MADQEPTLEAFFERAEAFSNSTLEIIKLNVVAKSADIVSSFISQLVLYITIAISLFIVNIGIALWIGTALGYAFYGFLIVGGFYALLAILLYFFRHQWIKNPVSNSIIKQMLKP